MKKPVSTEQRIILPDVSWRKFEEILQELGEDRTVRLTYDRGKLELMNVLPEHDRCNRLIESLILVLADELKLTLNSIMPILITAVDRMRAAEFDAGYYLQPMDSQVRDRRIDVTQLAPPDLLVEVAINRSKLDKFPIYADLEIPEIWRFITQPGEDVLKGGLLIYRLEDLHYVESKASRVFPMLTAKQVLEFIEQSDNIGLVQALKILRSWAKSHL